MDVTRKEHKEQSMETEAWMRNNFYFGEDDFFEKMDGLVKPWLKSAVRDAYFRAEDSAALHYHFAVNPNEKGAVVFSHGFCEFFPKFHETAYYFYQAGYSVFFIEHRGHGFSERAVRELDKVYVKDFHNYVSDFNQFVEEVVMPSSKTGKLYLYAHSMGGAVASLYLEERQDRFKCAVLSSPMHQLDMRGTPDWLVAALYFLSSVLRWDYKYAPSQHGFNPDDYDFANSGGLSEPRYQYVLNWRKAEPHYSTYGACYAWAKAALKGAALSVKNADKATTPILLCRAGMDNMVKPEAQDAFLAKAPNAELKLFPAAKHELFCALPDERIEYYKTIFKFYDAHR